MSILTEIIKNIIMVYALSASILVGNAYNDQTNYQEPQATEEMPYNDLAFGRNEFTAKMELIDKPNIYFMEGHSVKGH